jgi:hypothetical protein
VVNAGPRSDIGAENVEGRLTTKDEAEVVGQCPPTVAGTRGARSVPISSALDPDGQAAPATVACHNQMKQGRLTLP